MRLDTYRPYFIYNNIDSRQMGVYVTAMPPVIRAEKRVDTVTVGGRSGSLHIDEGAWDNYTRTMECAILDRRRIDEVAAWLTGSGDIIFSDELDKVYKIYIANQLSIEQMMLRFQKFIVTMDTYPFKYSVNALDDEVDVMTTTMELYNRGTVYADPVLTLYPTMQRALTIAPLVVINGFRYQLSALNEPIVIDSEMGEVYTLDGANANNLYLSDQFPRLEVGVNEIMMTNAIAKMHIKPNWRWL